MYNHNLIEKKWQKYWQEHKTFEFIDNNSPKFYALDMFPYPSGQGLHVGHPKGYTATDIVSRYKIHCGFNVLHPIGWDAFGLPAEQYALQTGNHPKNFTSKNIDHFREQLKSIGFSFDYEKEVNTTDPQYYKWTQWIFSKMFENGLAEIKDVDVNWCEELGTVLSNEEVLIIDNKTVSERGNFPVIKKPMRQWVLKITYYADKLLDGLNDLDWPESLKSIQRKWIGKSEGMIIDFKTNQNHKISVFTTRPDTIFGVSFISLAPENPFCKKIITKEFLQDFDNYLIQVKQKTEISRKENKEKTGIFSGSYAFNPITNEQIPIYIADYVLPDYGCGALMGVPGHDKRDFEFANFFKIPFKYIIETSDQTQAYTEDGKHINSDFLNGLNIDQATKKIVIFLQEKKLGQKHVTYKLKDWLFSRQRYWGEPFPIIFDKHNNPQLIKNIPLVLPDIKNIKPTKNGESPLANEKNWNNLLIGDQQFYRETNTMPQWAGSCWYFLGYILKQQNGNYLDLNSPQAFELFKRWLPVDLYIGGQEHAVLHLLYARFWYRFLYDIKIVPTKEPFQKIINQGMILGENGEKMSKSKGNVINPDEIIASHGADALRLYEMFMGPLTASLSWTEAGLNGIRKWLDRVYRLFSNRKEFNIVENFDPNEKDFEFIFNNFIKKITQCIENESFNVGISEMMIFINECYKHKNISQDYLKKFLIPFSCYAPHLADELWFNFLGGKDSIYREPWPTYDKKTLIKNIFNLPIQENGKLRDIMEINSSQSEQEIIKLAQSREKVIKFIGDKKIKKIIYIQNKILNFIL